MAIYRSAPRWHVFAALLTALALEAGAVAFASLQPRPEIPTELGGITEPPPAEVILTELPPEPTPPPDLAPPPLPPAPEEPNEYELEAPTPPPRPQHAPKPPPRVTTTQAAVSRPGPVAYIADRSDMLAAPRPSYSYEARRTRQTGSGKFLLRFDRGGHVIGVTLVQSTGSALLDDLARNSFQRWRCRPGAYEQVYVPITFTLTGAQL